MSTKPVPDRTAAEHYVRALLAARIGAVAHRLDADEVFGDLGVSSIDLVAVIAAMERDLGGGDQPPAELGEVASDLNSLTEYCIRLRGHAAGATR